MTRNDGFVDVHDGNPSVAIISQPHKSVAPAKATRLRPDSINVSISEV